MDNKKICREIEEPRHGDWIEGCPACRPLIWAGILCFGFAATDAAAQSGEADDGSAERGAYLAIAADCSGCHTQQEAGADNYAGGRGINSPFGIIYSPNITPDPDTGIGQWTYEDFEAALRQGVSKDGSYLYPAMPYVSYTKMTDRDIRDLWAYFQTVEPVEQEAPEDTVPFPYNVNLGLAGWQTMFFEQVRFQQDPEKDEDWNRGAYLVEALGHCGSCHTPRNFAYAQKSDAQLGGGEIEHWYAPNISGGRFSQLRDWSLDDIEAYLKTGRRDDNSYVAGPMAEVIEASLSRLEDADIEAIAVYLKDEPASDPGEPPEEVQVSADSIRDGGDLYALHCSGCHQQDGEGIDGIAPGLVDNELVTADQPNNAIMVLINGIAPSGKWGAMPSFAHSLNGEQLADVVNYIRTNWQNDAEPNATASEASTLRKASLDGGDVGQPAAICPVIQATRFDRDTFDALAGLPATEPGGSGELNSIVQDYTERHPDLATPETVTALYSMRCRQVIHAAGDRENGLKRMAAFAGEVARTLSDG